MNKTLFAGEALQFGTTTALGCVCIISLGGISHEPPLRGKCVGHHHQLVKKDLAFVRGVISQFAWIQFQQFAVQLL